MAATDLPASSLGGGNAAPRVLVLGLGNDVLTDDAVGLQVARELRSRLAGLTSVQVEETTEMGLALLDYLAGHEAAVLVDSIQTGKCPPGFVHELDARSLKQLTGRTPHFLGVGEALALGRKLEMPMPSQVRIFAIEVEDPFTLGTQLTPALQGALPAIVRQVEDAVTALVKRDA
ncbi:MAG TPA: hydrogenase maturation protease [Candidatus Acidoferrum sp.]|nr:hydrogenase maturation protease [Candidatus Acidoferrum sp.]